MTKDRFEKLQTPHPTKEAAVDAELTIAAAPLAEENRRALCDELRPISPAVAQRLEAAPALSATEWAEFKKNLQRELHVARPARTRVIKDRWSASNNRLTRLFAALIFLRR